MSRKLDKKVSIGERIWNAADNQGVTKGALAKSLNISRTTLDSWIKGTTHPDYEQILSASRILNVQFLSEPDPIKTMPLDVWDRLQRNFDNFEKDTEFAKSEVLFLREIIRNLSVNANKT